MTGTDRVTEMKLSGFLRSAAGLEQLNHTDAVEGHPDVPISRDFEFQPRISLRRGSLPDAFVSDAHQAPNAGGLVCRVELYSFDRDGRRLVQRLGYP